MTSDDVRGLAVDLLERLDVLQEERRDMDPPVIPPSMTAKLHILASSGVEQAAPAPGPAMEEMLALAREAIADEATYAARLLAVPAGEELLRAFIAEHGRPVPAADPLASMRADLKVKKTPDVDE